MFYLLDQPTEKEFQNLAKRYREMNPMAVKAAVTLLRTGSDMITGFERLMGRYGLSQGRFLILVVMNRQPDELTSPSVLAQKIGVTRATMTRLIDGLERDGLIRRHVHGTDRRRQEIQLTANGRSVLEKILPDYWSRIDTLMTGLDEKEQQVLIGLLTKVAGKIPSLTDKAPMAIRSFEPDQTQAVLDLILRIQQQEFAIPITAADQPDLAGIPDFYQTGTGNFWVASQGSQVLGTIALLDIGNRQGALRKMFVHPDWRGSEKGISNRLLQTLLQWAAQKGISEIFLGTTDKFRAAHRFYEKNGFEEISKTALPPSFPIMAVDTRFYRLGI